MPESIASVPSPVVPAQATTVSLPSSNEPTELDSAVSDFIKQTEQEYAAADLEAATSTGPTPGDQSAPSDGHPEAESAAGQGEGAQPDAGKANQSPSVATEVVRALEESRAKARKEKAARKAARKASERAQKQEPAAPQDEIETLRQMGLDPDVVVRKVLANKLAQSGKEVPAELRESIYKSEMQAQMARLENKVIAQSRELAARQYFDQISSGAKTYLAGDISKDAPTVSEVVKRDPAFAQRLHAEVMQELINDARARQQTDPNGDVMPYATALSLVEKRYAEYRKLFSPAPSQGGSQEATTNQAAPQPNMGPKKSSVIKTPDRPLPPWLQRQPSEEDGIRAAVDEFRRIEFAQKK